MKVTAVLSGEESRVRVFSMKWYPWWSAVAQFGRDWPCWASCAEIWPRQTWSAFSSLPDLGTCNPFASKQRSQFLLHIFHTFNLDKPWPRQKLADFGELVCFCVFRVVIVYQDAKNLVVGAKGEDGFTGALSHFHEDSRAYAVRFFQPMCFLMFESLQSCRMDQKCSD